MVGKRIIVIGAGVVGSATALALADADYDVEVIERSAPASGASFGNASFLGSTECVPMASPGVMRNVPGWVLRQKGPLFVAPDHLLRLAPWLLRFAMNSSPARTEANAASLARLLRNSKADSLAWLARIGLPQHLSQTENLRLYPTEAQFEADSYKLGLRKAHGAAYTQLGAGEIADLEPGIKGRYAVGLLAKGAHYFQTPTQPVTQSIDLLCAAGGRYRRDRVSRLDVTGGEVKVYLGSGDCLSADHVVVAAGIDSADLARTIGDRFPLASERGYHLQYPGLDIGLSRGVIDTARGVAVTPLSGALRVAGIVEFSRRTRPANARCLQALETAASYMLGDGFGEGREVSSWLGERPSLPDGLPVIGASVRHPQILYNFGHGHLGLTLAATSARLVAAHLRKDPPQDAMAGVSPQRF